MVTHLPAGQLVVLDDLKVERLPRSQAHAFHGLEFPLRSVGGARALRIVHPARQTILPHRHDWPLLTLPALGGYEEESDEGSVAVSGPAVVLHPPGLCHANCIHALGMETFSLEFDPAWLRLGRSDPLFDRSFYWIGGPAALASRVLARLWSNKSTNEGALQSATAAFLGRAVRTSPTRAPHWLDAVRRRIASGEATTVRQIASIVGIHPRWLAHSYRRVVGEGLHDTILRQRVEQAAHQLRTSSQSIAEIAFDAGFCDQSHLNRSVRRLTGRTPAQIRGERERLSRLLDR